MTIHAWPAGHINTVMCLKRLN